MGKIETKSALLNIIGWSEFSQLPYKLSNKENIMKRVSFALFLLTFGCAGTGTSGSGSASTSPPPAANPAQPQPQPVHPTARDGYQSQLITWCVPLFFSEQANVFSEPIMSRLWNEELEQHPNMDIKDRCTMWDTDRKRLEGEYSRMKSDDKGYAEKVNRRDYACLQWRIYCTGN